MPHQTAKLIGGPGTGKTRGLLEAMTQAVQRLGSAMRVGFTTYTRAARREASSRAASLFGESVHTLEREGWFRTLHSICFHAVGVDRGQMITDNSESKEWLEDALQAAVTPLANDGNEYGQLAREGDATDADRALTIWAAARNRLEPLAEAHRRADEVDGRTPSLADCRRVVDQYEAAKRRDERLDFVDLLGRFAGRWFHPVGHEYQEPEGEPPDVDAWVVDEAQDLNPLKATVVWRLAADCRWLYLGADPFQSIFGYEGGDPTLFLGWPAEKERVMPRSHRCAAEVLALGERVIGDTAGYRNRGIEPAGPGGDVSAAGARSFLEGLDAREDWLVLARTNRQVGQIGAVLHAAAVPWATVRGDKHAPVRQLAIQGFLAIEGGAPLDGSQWQAILKLDKASGGGVDARRYLQHGAKARWRDQPEAAERWPWITPDELIAEEYGGTYELLKAVQAGRWRDWVRDADWYPEACRRWGPELCERPRVRIGTVHAAKGREADNVAVLTTLTRPCAAGMRTGSGRDEECRVAYVAVTRARRRVVLLHERTLYRMPNLM